jgi:hypothetical protein
MQINGFMPNIATNLSQRLTLINKRQHTPLRTQQITGQINVLFDRTERRNYI